MKECEYCKEYHDFNVPCMSKMEMEFHFKTHEVTTQLDRDILKVKEIVTRMKGQIEQKRLYAQLWMTRATSGSYKERVGNVTDGAGRQHTEEEILQDTIKTARHHIQDLDDYTESLIIFQKTLEILKLKKEKATCG